MFHNTLVVGSSPTSSTTQSPATGDKRSSVAAIYRCAKVLQVEAVSGRRRGAVVPHCPRSSRFDRL